MALDGGSASSVETGAAKSGDSEWLSEDAKHEGVQQADTFFRSMLAMITAMREEDNFNIYLIVTVLNELNELLLGVVPHINTIH